MAVDENVSEKQKLWERLQCLKASDPALDDEDNRKQLRRIFGIKEPVVVKHDPRFPKIPDTPIRSRDAIVAYLARDFSVQAYAASTTAPAGKLWQPFQVQQLQASTFNTANIPPNATLGLLWSNPLVLEFDESTVAGIFSKFCADIDPLTNVPVIVAKHKRYALLKVAGYRILHEGTIPGSQVIRAYGLTNFRRLIAPPSYDPAGGLSLLTWSDPNHTVPAFPSASLLRWLTSSAMVLEHTEPAT